MVEASGLQRLVFVRYLDHVLFSRCSPLVLKPQLREAVGWLNYECEQYIVVSWDRDAEPPTLKGGDPKASGLVLLQSCILELQTLNAQKTPLQKTCYWDLNSASTKVSSEYALPPTERKTHRPKTGETENDN